MDLPLVYAVVLAWRRQADTIECIRSLSEGHYSNLRVLLVDNASGDGTPQMVRASYPEVELIINEENLGFAAGNNVGIDHALQRGADYVLLLNNDTVVCRSLVGTLVTVAQADRKIGLLTPKIYFYNHRARIWSAGARKPMLFPGLKMVGFGENDGPAYNQLKELDYTTACALLVRTEVFRKVGAFDPEYFMYYEDCDFSIRVKGAGYKIVYVPDAKVWHKASLRTKEAPSTKWYYLAKSTVPFCLRYSRAPYLSLSLYVGWLILRESVKGNLVAARLCLRGMRDGLSDTIRN